MSDTQPRRTYGQFCGLARALDHIGDRWTLLIVRELLAGPTGFAALRSALPGLASNLLVQRLGDLEADGLVTRSDHPPRSKSVRYELTEAGKGLEPAVLALIRWGAVWMASGPGEDFVNPRWAALALRALLGNPETKEPAGALAIDAGGEDLTVSIGGNGRVVVSGRSEGRPRARVRGPFSAILAVASGQTLLAASESITVEGDRSFAAAALSGAPTGSRSKA